MRCFKGFDNAHTSIGQVVPAPGSGFREQEFTAIALPNAQPINRIESILKPGLKYVVRTTNAGTQIKIVGSVISLPIPGRSQLRIVMIPVTGTGDVELVPISSFIGMSWKLVTPENTIKLAEKGLVRTSFQSPISFRELDESLDSMKARVANARVQLEEGKFPEARSLVKLANEDVRAAIEKLKVLRDIGLLTEESVFTFRETFEDITNSTGRLIIEIERRSSVVGDFIFKLEELFQNVAQRLASVVISDVKRYLTVISNMMKDVRATRDLALEISKNPAVAEKNQDLLKILNSRIQLMSTALDQLREAMKAEDIDLDITLRDAGLGAGLIAGAVGKVSINLAAFIFSIGIFISFVIIPLVDRITGREERILKEQQTFQLFAQFLAQAGPDITPEEIQKLRERAERMAGASAELIESISKLTPEAKLAAGITLKRERDRQGLFRITPPKKEEPVVESALPTILTVGLISLPIALVLFTKR